MVLAANSRPSINDITALELAAVVVRSAGRLDATLGRSLSESALGVVPSGSELPVIDLRRGVCGGRLMLHLLCTCLL